MNAGCIIAAASLATAAAGQTIVNASFDDPAAGWTLNNDAGMAVSGGAAGWSWTAGLGGDVISTEDVFPVRGSGFAMTYAGGDSFTQTITLPVPGEYVLQVNYQGIEGAWNGSPLFDGEFQLFAGGEASPIEATTPVGGWQHFGWAVNLPAGEISIGIRNTAIAPYAIAFDNFSIVVPAPASGAALASLGLLAGRRRRG